MKVKDGRGKHGKQGRKKGIKKISKSFSIDAEFALDKTVNSKLVNDLLKENVPSIADGGTTVSSADFQQKAQYEAPKLNLK